MSIVHEGFTKFVELNRSVDNRVITEARAEVIDELLKVSEVRELKLQEEPSASQSSFEIAIRGLKVRVANKKIITKRQEYIVELEARLGKTKALLHRPKNELQPLPPKLSRITRNRRTFSKKSPRLQRPPIRSSSMTTRIKVAQSHPQLDLSKIATVEGKPRGEDEKTIEGKAYC